MSELKLALRQVRYTNKAFWRNPASAFFTFVFPLMFLVIFTVLFNSGTTCIRSVAGRCAPGAEVNTSTFYVASISAFSVITACYTNIAISLSFARDAGVLKRIKGSPIPTWAYLLGRVAHATLVAILLVAITALFGRVAYHARLPIATLGPYLLTVVVGAASFAALGMALLSVIPNADAAPPVVNASILPLLFISNVFIPLGPNPEPWVDTLSKIFPVRHFVEAMFGSFFRFPGQSALQRGDLLVVALWGLAGLVLALRFFSWEPRQ
jgi:ABC-2 type transport system permease protein